ncbi:MAG: transcription-repair coupling factor [Chloroflexi bacterium]|nr:transcription-repair coupling factor [Chloroflexota bacterium]
MAELTLAGLVPVIRRSRAYQQLTLSLQGDNPLPEPLGLLEAARPMVAAALFGDVNRPFLWLAATPDRARRLSMQLGIWMQNPQRVKLYPEPDALPYERIAWDPVTVQGRLDVMKDLLRTHDEQDAPAPFVVASVRSLFHLTIGLEQFRAVRKTLRRHQTIDPDKLVRDLMALGYEPASIVALPGTFSRRGGILDLFPAAATQPVRLDFFGDEIDTLRQFDPATQRSGAHLDTVTLGPGSEAVLQQHARAAAALRQLDLDALSAPAQLAFSEHLANLEQGVRFKGLEYYLPWLAEPPATLLDYLPANALVIVDDLAEVSAAMAELESQAMQIESDLVREAEIPAGLPLPYISWDELQVQIQRLRTLVLGYGNPEESHPLALRFVAPPRYGGRMKDVIVDSFELEAGQSLVIASRQAPRIAELFEEHGTYVTPVAAITESPKLNSLTLVQGAVAEGFIFKQEEARVRLTHARLGKPEAQAENPPKAEQGGLVLLTDGEIFGWRMPQPRRATARPKEAPEQFFADLRPGDYVVHVDHGIAMFQGLVRRTFSGIEREYLQIEYAQGDMLYVPTYQVDRVTRYVGLGDRPPTVHRLGATDWETVKSQAKKAVAEIARDLLEIYAAREIVPGHAFGPDTPWQVELEAAFPYAETEDQQHAIEVVKRDMEQPRPMDRLICGDVGYGKTEVALRAAFKAVMDGKQVAVLVPTTILAQQHYVTFKERLSAFPMEVEMLSRFRSHKEQMQILEKLAAGKVDIVIGTHRLLQPDVLFHDLGLMIIDEEQRFGVTHKERLKEMRKEVDVLTMTATPIPRTLHMALTGVRDMSSINTPPQERLPIITYVQEYDEATVRQAMLREVDRGGQVYFVHNRVQSIHLVTNRLKRLLPEVRFGIGHGQMDEAELAQVMLDFSAGKFDVLVCTSIVESGLDIPNCNTMIINHADHFGLAQLYQLRGRVGRSSRRAYCYLLYRQNTALSEDARRRLQAIQEASELGAGYRIAMRDLEIRGAGDLLGARQHGHIVAVGFDLYTRLLTHAVQELRAGGGAARLLEPERFAPPLTGGPLIELPLSALIPQHYVADANLRLQLYRRMSQITKVQEVEELAQEFADRFGPRPPEMDNLLFVLRIKSMANQVDATSISTEAGRVVLRMDGRDIPDRDRLTRRYGDEIIVGRRSLSIPVYLNGSPAGWQERLLEVLNDLVRACQRAA